jgi:hypothetical protein
MEDLAETKNKKMAQRGRVRSPQPTAPASGNSIGVAGRRTERARRKASEAEGERKLGEGNHTSSAAGFYPEVNWGAQMSSTGHNSRPPRWHASPTNYWPINSESQARWKPLTGAGQGTARPACPTWQHEALDHHRQPHAHHQPVPTTLEPRHSDANSTSLGRKCKVGYGHRSQKQCVHHSSAQYSTAMEKEGNALGLSIHRPRREGYANGAAPQPLLTGPTCRWPHLSLSS